MDDPVGVRRTLSPVIVQIGLLDPGQVFGWAVAITVVALAIGIGLSARVAHRRGRRALTVGLAVVTVLEVVVGVPFWMVTAFVSSSTSTEVRGDTGGRELVVRENGLWGTVYERHGLELHLLGRMSTTHSALAGYTGVADGRYAVRSSGSADGTGGRTVYLAWSVRDGWGLTQRLVIDDDSASQAARGRVPNSEHCEDDPHAPPSTEIDGSPTPFCLLPDPGS
ncbi:hypothetical protein FJ656_26195 [Schumannella luteola]|nr:hypothetical protein FJ656_26195 [Schumannella luteola]